MGAKRIRTSRQQLIEEPATLADRTANGAGADAEPARELALEEERWIELLRNTHRVLGGGGDEAFQETVALNVKYALEEYEEARKSPHQHKAKSRKTSENEAFSRLSDFSRSAATGIDIVGEILMVYDAPPGHPQWQRAVIRELAEDIKILLRALSSPDHADAGKVEGDGAKWPIREVVAKAIAYQAVGDPHARTIRGDQRWEWFTDEADKFISVFGCYLPSAPSQEVAG
ncbi:hypothetical protein [Brucella intermedia]|uniref:hypothetical protein n=1 Tax=Brucella intermedia TaxID=94625 RepID=UPI00244707AC|nr:hypothetical protein [Brucella intermedia]WGG61902.1 hypothetical protein QA414_15395 [Brucella intermedia]